MEKTILNHHSSNVVAFCENTGEYLLGQFDPSYPGRNQHWKGRGKLLGGNYFFGKDTDKSPLETLTREIKEEFSGLKAAAEEMSASQEHTFAPVAEIEFVRLALLKNTPFQDYFLNYRDAKDNSVVYVILSAFMVSISKEVVDCVKNNLSKGKSLTNEGFLAVKNITELIAGDPLTQGITGLVISQREGVFIPHCLKDLFTFAPVGKPRDSYESYSDVFQYRDHSKKLNAGF